jgi:hypothetical protein
VDTIVPYPNSSQSFNRYSYCRNNPLRYIDPTGHWDADGNSSEGFGGHGIGNPGSYGGQQSVGAPGFGDGYGVGMDNHGGSSAQNTSISESRTRDLADRADYDTRAKMAIDPKSKKHTYRNRYNKCPCTREEALTNNNYEKDNVFSSAQYHGHLKGKRTFRAKKGTPEEGSQCTYNEDGTLDDHSRDMGTYDYGEPATKEHMDLDVTPHNYNPNYEGGLTSQF